MILTRGGSTASDVVDCWEVEAGAGEQSSHGLSIYLQYQYNLTLAKLQQVDYWQVERGKSIFVGFWWYYALWCPSWSIITMDNCTIDCIEIIGRYSREETCNFVTSSCEQDTVQFIQTYFCELNQSFILLILMSVRFSSFRPLSCFSSTMRSILSLITTLLLALKSSSRN